MDNRNYMGKNKDGVIFPVAPNLSEMSDAYLKFITIFYKGIMPSEKVLDFPVDCNTLTGSVNL